VPGFQVVGALDGYFDACRQLAVLDEITDARPDLLVVGMGTPRQERWAAEHASCLRVPLTWTVGALFDYAGGRERRCPPWMGNHGLEWLFRFCMQPRRMAARYLVGNPLFVSAVVRQSLYQAISRRSKGKMASA
jgi:N-acetylglucosaminyldiphosphoundecaprenol N-acetyl-beta-D-mannosaminyltransferase